jgi:hypothetical protein
MIGHARGPGRERLELGAFWASLPDGPEDDFITRIARDAGVELCPMICPEARLCLLYRNPLDQTLSAFTQQSHRLWLRAGETRFASPADAFHRGQVAAGGLRTVATWRGLRARCPDAVLLVRYEDLLRAPHATFETIARHLFGPVEEAALNRAIDLCTPERMREYERTQGHPLPGPQIDARYSHLNGFPIGAWRSFLGETEYRAVAEICARLQIPIEAFDFG